MDHQIITNGSVIWVNDSTGHCVARFSKRGIDIHKSVKEQVGGSPQCLKCTHTKPDWGDWLMFKSDMLKLHGATITNSHKPLWLTSQEGNNGNS